MMKGVEPEKARSKARDSCGVSSSERPGPTVHDNVSMGLPDTCTLWNWAMVLFHENLNLFSNWGSSVPSDVTVQQGLVNMDCVNRAGLRQNIIIGVFLTWHQSLCYRTGTF